MITEVMTYINDGKPLDMDDMREISEHGVPSSCKPSRAIYYHEAAGVMAKYGDEIVEFLDTDIPGIDSYSTSYQGWCCDVVSMAVELYCHLQVEEQDYVMDRSERDIEPSEYTEWQDYDSDC